jgi:hypothetical protein
MPPAATTISKLPKNTEPITATGIHTIHPKAIPNAPLSTMLTLALFDLAGHGESR